MLLRRPFRLLAAKFFSKADAIAVKNYDGTVRRRADHNLAIG